MVGLISPVVLWLHSRYDSTGEGMGLRKSRGRGRLGSNAHLRW
jgi:hypothetical protein